MSKPPSKACADSTATKERMQLRSQKKKKEEDKCTAVPSETAAEGTATAMAVEEAPQSAAPVSLPSLGAVLFQILAEQKIRQTFLSRVRDIWSKGKPAVMSIMPTVDDGEEVRPFHYTVGMPKFFGVPEVCISGLPHKAGLQILNNLIRSFEKKEITEIRADQVLPQPLSPVVGFDVKFVAVSDTGNHLKVAMDRSLEPDMKKCGGYGKALQIVWPYRNGVFQFPTAFQPAL